MNAHFSEDAMSLDSLFTPATFGAIQLKNRIIMPPLTRMRCPGGIPSELNAEYYAQRSSAGLIVTEATAVSVQGHGYPNMPGIHNDEQVAGWRGVTDAVHARGGRIVLQIVHHGRWSHSSYNPDGRLPVAPSAIAASAGHAYTPTGQLVDWETPRALELAEVPAIVSAFRAAGLGAVRAGFDGVEVHAGNGFLLDQFLQDGSNRRTDAYGGPIANRARLLLEIVDCIAADIGADRVAVRLSPFGNLGGVSDQNTVADFSYVIAELTNRSTAYLHLIEPRASSAGIGDDASLDSANNLDLFSALFDGPIITAGGYSGITGAHAIDSGAADAVAYGRMFAANPDLVERLRIDAVLNTFDRTTAYGGGPHGYTDYPFLQTSVVI
jgi:N-ethylmaleimide reductase